jgi:acyl-CoA thioester hydrolase
MRTTNVEDFVFKIRIYYEDTDSAGVVYHANYVKFLERARSEWLRALGIDQKSLLDAAGVQFVVRQFSLRLRQPARYDDELSVVCRLAESHPFRMGFIQQIWCGALLVDAKVEVVCVNKLTFKPVIIPEWIQQLLKD